MHLNLRCFRSSFGAKVFQNHWPRLASISGDPSSHPAAIRAMAAPTSVSRDLSDLLGLTSGAVDVASTVAGPVLRTSPDPEVASLSSSGAMSLIIPLRASLPYGPRASCRTRKPCRRTPASPSCRTCEPSLSSAGINSLRRWKSKSTLSLATLVLGLASSGAPQAAPQGRGR